MVRPVVLAVAFVSFTLSASAQLSGSPAHNHPGLAPTQQIDGSVNPEKIPDLTAYRLFFLVAGTTPNSKPEDLARRQAHIRKIGLTEQDNQLLIPILNDFCAQYADLIQQYNASAKALATRGQVADPKPFLLVRDNLVQTTREKLKVLTPEGVSRLDQHVQREKRGMKSVLPASQ